ncbi:MAG TPA: LytTR family DNA-binding domain-containing protein [Pyrinomonadaceae bacterium]|jgi:DNA-binding LytR/AlgR family response regulator
MKVVIIEDEPPAREKLAKFIRRYDSRIEIRAQLESVAATLRYFDGHTAPELVFADIELLDGNVFEVFENRKIACPVIFTTAYDQFLLQAFEQSGIAYLLKPFDFQKFAAAMQKFETLKNNFGWANNALLREIRENLRLEPKYRERFVIKTAGGIRLIETRQIAFVQMKNEIPFAFDAAGNKFPLGATLTELEKTLDPNLFFRLNRSEIVNLDFIENLKPDFHDRLVVCLRNLNVKLVSSASRTPSLRKWLENI